MSNGFSIYMYSTVYNNTGSISIDVLISAAIIDLFAIFSLLNVTDGLSVFPTSMAFLVYQFLDNLTKPNIRR